MAESEFAWAGVHAKELERLAEARQILRMTLSDVPAGHVIDVSKMRPRWLAQKIAGLVAVGADVSHDTVLLAYPKGQEKTFVVVRKGSVKTSPGTYALNYPIVAAKRGVTKIAIEIEIKGDASTALRVVNSVLDAGTLQNELHEHPDSDLRVLDVSARVL